ncbi:hypothetical protein HOY80DRAFT_1041749 [Tuber brumale]|nr:hypothetical protein HOY80DRAFT_1041749 [Tuber brumale]
MFDAYFITVNPDDGYKVVVFDIDLFGCDGKILDPVCRNPADPHCVSDQLLRWHFHQSVLANVRGTGEPIFEHDFPPGTDMVGEILAGPYARERFELEIVARLREVFLGTTVSIPERFCSCRFNDTSQAIVTFFGGLA